MFSVILVSPVPVPNDLINCGSIEDLSSNEPLFSVSKQMKASAIVDLPLMILAKSSVVIFFEGSKVNCYGLGSTSKRGYVEVI